MVDIYVGEENTHWILHEKLLCHRSKFFRNIFYNKEGNKNHTYGLPDEDDGPFKLFVGWLYSTHVPPVAEEKDLSPLIDLYLMGEKWEIRSLVTDVMEQIRKWYSDSDTLPSLRRVQYVYANTEQESPLRVLLVSCVARMLVLGEGMPAHWDKALRKNGQLAVDIILAVQKWHLEGENVPDARQESVEPIVQESEEQKEHIKQEQEAEQEGEQEDEIKQESDEGEAEGGEEEEQEEEQVNGVEHEEEES